MGLSFHAKVIMASPLEKNMMELKRLCDAMEITYPDELEKFIEDSESYLKYEMERVDDCSSEMRIPISAIPQGAEFIVFEIGG